MTTASSMAAGNAELPYSVSWRTEWKYRFIYWVTSYPALMPLARLRYSHIPELLVKPDSELVIEGYGRSGSTFANFAFQSAQSVPVNTVHHTHAAAQVILAARMRLPTLVIVRRPLDAALSHMVRHNVTARAALAAWVRFHRRVLPYRDRIVVAPFESITSDFGAVVRRINQKFGTNFAEFKHTRENEEAVFERIRQRNRTLWRAADRPRALAIPRGDRESLKASLRLQLLTKELAPLLKKANQLYAEILQPKERDLLRRR
jgi:hypothetical protein